MRGRCPTLIRTVLRANPSTWPILSTQRYYSTTQVRFINYIEMHRGFIHFCEGPSIRIHTVTSPTGGIFSVWIDGVDTNNTIDTFSVQGNQKFPVCFPVQFPPFSTTPPGFETHSNHTIKLVYVGTSKFAPAGTNTSNFQFDSFAIPVLGSTTSGGISPAVHIHIVFFFFFCLSVYFSQ